MYSQVINANFYINQYIYVKHRSETTTTFISINIYVKHRSETTTNLK